MPHDQRFKEWDIQFSGRWSLAEIIFTTARRVGSSKCRDTDHLIFCDDLGFLLAVCMGRSTLFAVLVQLHKLLALGLAVNSRFHVRWVASELNAADPGSRAPEAQWQMVAPGASDGRGP